MPNPIQTFLKRSRQSWVLLAQSGLWMAGVIAGFLLPPPVGSADESKIWVRFAQFAITIIVGVVLLAGLRWQRKHDAFRWAGISLLFLLLGTSAFFTYQWFAARWTATYFNHPVLIGGVYTTQGREWHQSNPTAPPEQILMDFAGKLESIWTRESIQERQLLLAGLYVLAMPLFTICMMSIVQAIHCAVAATTPRRKRARPIATKVSPR